VGKQVDKLRTRSSHMEREAIFEREARSRAVNECSWLREKLRSLYAKVLFLTRDTTSVYHSACLASHLPTSDVRKRLSTSNLQKAVQAPSHRHTHMILECGGLWIVDSRGLVDQECRSRLPCVE